MNKFVCSLIFLICVSASAHAKDNESFVAATSIFEQIKADGRIHPAGNINLPSLERVNERLSKSIKAFGGIKEYKETDSSLAPLLHQYIFEVTYSSGFHQPFVMYLYKAESGWVVTNISFEKFESIKPENSSPATNKGPASAGPT